jgi:SAM-dependent methyltransferase
MTQASADEPLPSVLFERLDETPDPLFYAVPRFVQHIDDETIAALTAYYGQNLQLGADVLDLMSSWVSHLPAELPLGHVAGVGLNAEELAANPRLRQWMVQDLNTDHELRFDDAIFDAVLIAVSIQYLVQPVAVLTEVARVLRPGGQLIIATSHRCFPTKAVRAFRTLEPNARLRLIGEYIHRAGGFAPAEFDDRSPLRGDPLWLVRAARSTASYDQPVIE